MTTIWSSQLICGGRRKNDPWLLYILVTWDKNPCRLHGISTQLLSEFIVRPQHSPAIHTAPVYKHVHLNIELDLAYPCPSTVTGRKTEKNGEKMV
jgi:hypothetical protein